MSFYIKGMEMPTIEMEWTIRYGADGKWYAIDTNAETTDGEWHEIIPVPKHGRLIDVSVLMREMHNVILEDGEDRRIFYSVIERQPTIIPADDKDTDVPIKEEGET